MLNPLTSIKPLSAVFSSFRLLLRGARIEKRHLHKSWRDCRVESGATWKIANFWLGKFFKLLLSRARVPCWINMLKCWLENARWSFVSMLLSGFGRNAIQIWHLSVLVVKRKTLVLARKQKGGETGWGSVKQISFEWYVGFCRETKDQIWSYRLALIKPWRLLMGFYIS